MKGTTTSPFQLSATIWIIFLIIFDFAMKMSEIPSQHSLFSSIMNTKHLWNKCALITWPNHTWILFYYFLNLFTFILLERARERDKWRKGGREEVGERETEGEGVRGRERERTNPLFHFPKAWSSQGWSRPNPRARNSIWSWWQTSKDLKHHLLPTRVCISGRLD